MRKGKGRLCRDSSLITHYSSLPYYERPKAQRVHSRPHEAIHRLLGAADDRLVLVEAGVQDHGDAGAVAEAGDQVVVERVLVAADGLEAAGVVDVVDGPAFLAVLRADLVDV